MSEASYECLNYTIFSLIVYRDMNTDKTQQRFSQLEKNSK